MNHDPVIEHYICCHSDANTGGKRQVNCPMMTSESTVTVGGAGIGPVAADAGRPGARAATKMFDDTACQCPSDDPQAWNWRTVAREGNAVDREGQLTSNVKRLLLLSCTGSCWYHSKYYTMEPLSSASQKVAEDEMSVALPCPEPDPSWARHASCYGKRSLCQHCQWQACRAFESCHQRTQLLL